MAEKAKIETKNVFFLYQGYRTEYPAPKEGPRKEYLYSGEKGLDVCAYLPHEFALYFRIKNGEWGHSKKNPLDILTVTFPHLGQCGVGPVIKSKSFEPGKNVKAQLEALVDEGIFNKEKYSLKVLSIDKKNAHIGMFGAENRNRLGKRVIDYLNQSDYCDVDGTNKVLVTYSIGEHIAKQMHL